MSEKPKSNKRKRAVQIAVLCIALVAGLSVVFAKGGFSRSCVYPAHPYDEMNNWCVIYRGVVHTSPPGSLNGLQFRGGGGCAFEKGLSVHIPGIDIPQCQESL